MIGLSEELMTGIEHIDSAHFSIVKQVNTVLETLKNTEAKTVINQSIHYLENHLIEHFQDEEELQIASGYPDYKDHHKAHEQLVEEMSVLFEEYDSYANLSTTKKMIIKLISEVLFNHIQTMDKSLADHIRKSQYISE